MNISHDQPSDMASEALAALQTALNKALEKKRKLGQYAVSWKNSEVVYEYFGNQPAPNIDKTDNEQS